jgi:hypothetical protein
MVKNLFWLWIVIKPGADLQQAGHRTLSIEKCFEKRAKRRAERRNATIHHNHLILNEKKQKHRTNLEGHQSAPA